MRIDVSRSQQLRALHEMSSWSVILSCPDVLLPCMQAWLKNPCTPELWLAAVRLEQRAGNTKAALRLMAR